jgi:dihydrofolate reductase
VRRLVVSEFVTLDGVMEAPGGEPTHPHTGWVGDRFGPEIMAYKLAEILDADSLLIGRVTYESFAGAWPEHDGEMADQLNSMRKDVVSSTLRDPAWANTHVIDPASLVAAVDALKSSAGGPILVHGSATLVHALLLEGLVDELRLMVFPVAIGQGLRVFPEERVKQSFELASQENLDGGVLALSYSPA